MEAPSATINWMDGKTNAFYSYSHTVRLQPNHTHDEGILNPYYYRIAKWLCNPVLVPILQE